MAKILFVLTGADHWTLADGTKHPTGFWAEEAVAPYKAFKAAGHEIVVATPGGVIPTVDEGSLAPQFNGGEEGAKKIADTLASITELRHPIKLEDVVPGGYDAVFYPGGHGPMEDLAVDSDSGALLTLTRSPASHSASSATPRPRCWPPGTRSAARRSRATG